jgi:hypothetical protein
MCKCANVQMCKFPDVKVNESEQLKEKHHMGALIYY